ncbi:MAG: glutamyl-tRNA reductase, partial [Methanomicrobiaceae archaeon]|nr:glutamyl-tRNA reductase [Methanomicrobiaceae archaeon]
DIAQPRDIEEEVGNIAGIHLFTIDNLRTVSENNLANRRMEAERARAYIEAELDHFIRLLRRTASDDTIALLYTWAESIRTRERDRALSRLGTGNDERAREVLDDLTRVLTKKLLSDATLSIRSSAEQGDMQAADSLVRAITRGEKLCFRKEE